MPSNEKVSLEEIRSQIAEWFAQEYELSAVAHLHTELRIMIDQEMTFMMSNILGERIREDRVGRVIRNG